MSLRRSIAQLGCFSLVIAAGPVVAGNLLVNPGFETQPISAAWSSFGNVGVLSASVDQPHSGCFYVYC